MASFERRSRTCRTCWSPPPWAATAVTVCNPKIRDRQYTGSNLLVAIARSIFLRCTAGMASAAQFPISDSHSSAVQWREPLVQGTHRRRFCAGCSTAALAGRAEVGAMLAAEFAARNWAVDQSDIDRVLALLHRQEEAQPPLVEVPISSAKTPPPLTKTPPPLAESPRIFSPSQDFEPFLDSVGSGHEIVAHVQRLVTATDTDQAIAAARALFVDTLAYEHAHVEETPRLRSAVTLTRLVSIARHGSFCISVAETDYTQAHPSVGQPVFQLHPHGLATSFSPGQSCCRFIFRQIDGSLRLRTLVGDRIGRDAGDTLALWAFRLHLLRPGYDDDASTLVERAQRAMSTPAAQLARGSGPPHLYLREQNRRAYPGLKRPVEVFCLPSARRNSVEMRWHVGLERALRNCLPAFVANDRAVLAYEGYALSGSAPGDPEMAFVAGASFVQPVTLRLSLRFADRPARLPLAIEASVPAISSDGRLLLYGTWYRLVPRVRADGTTCLGPATGTGEEIDGASLCVLLENSRRAQASLSAESRAAAVRRPGRIGPGRAHRRGGAPAERPRRGVASCQQGFFTLDA